VCPTLDVARRADTGLRLGLRTFLETTGTDASRARKLLIQILHGCSMPHLSSEIYLSQKGAPSPVSTPNEVRCTNYNCICICFSAGGLHWLPPAANGSAAIGGT
jgi:hypothetical protein